MSKNPKNFVMNAKKLIAALLAGLQVVVPTLSWAQSAPTTTFTYDAVGQITSATSPGGRTTQYQWDALGRNVQQSRAGVTVGYGYNFQNALTAVQDPRGLVTTYARDGFGEAQSQTSPDTGTTTLARDAAGNVTSRVNAAGQVENYTYDAANRVVSKALSHPASGSITYGFAYGTSGAEAGQLVQVSAPGLVLSYAHNLYGQVTSATQALAGTASLTTGYGYASNGAPTGVTYPSGRVVSYTLDGASRISAISVDGNAVLSGVAYSALGAVTGWSFAGGQAVSRTFDANARITSVTMPWGARQYSYDVDDRIVGINDAILGSATYAYDDQNRLTSASNSFGSWTYQYDANGNRTAGTVNGSGYGTSVDSGSNRMLAAGQRQNSFTADGQTSQVTSAAVPSACGTALTLGYQADGQLVTSNGLSAVHAPNGLRLQKTAAACANGTKTNFVYDTAGHLIGEYDAVGAVIQETVWLGDLPVAVFQAAGSSTPAYYVYADNLGTPRGITTASGMPVWTWDGEPFGASPAIIGQIGQQAPFRYGLRFPGQYFDEETGYHHNGWREYDPALGRYVQSDPMGLGGGLNTYAYVQNNPLGLADASGLCPVCLLGLAPEVVAGATAAGTTLLLRFAPQINSIGIAIAEGWGGVSVGIPSAGPLAANVAKQAESQFCALTSRLGDLYSKMGPEQRKRITMAVGLAEDVQGNRALVIGTSERNGYLRPGITTLPGEFVAKGTGHAEADIVNFAAQNNLNLLAVGATRPICPNCATAVSSSGAQAVTPLKNAK